MCRIRVIPARVLGACQEKTSEVSCARSVRRHSLALESTEPFSLAGSCQGPHHRTRSHRSMTILIFESPAPRAAPGFLDTIYPARAKRRGKDRHWLAGDPEMTANPRTIVAGSPRIQPTSSLLMWCLRTVHIDLLDRELDLILLNPMS